MFYGFLGQRRGDVITQRASASTTPLDVTLDNGLTFIETLSNPFQGGIQEPVGAARASRRSWARASRSSIPTRGRRGCSGGRSACSASCRGNWVAEVRLRRQLRLADPDDPQPERHAESSTSARARRAIRRRTTISSADGAEPVRRPDAADRGSGVPRRDHRAGAAAAAVSAVRRREHDDQRRRVVVSRAAGRDSSGASPPATRFGINYTYSRFTEAIEFLNAADPEPRKGISGQDVPHRLTVSGIWELPFGRGRRLRQRRTPVARHAHRRLAGSGDLLVPERHSRSGSATSSSRVTSTTSPCLPASGPSLRWFNTDAGFNKVIGAAARVERPHLPAAAGQRSQDGHDQQRRPVGHQEHGDRPRRRCSSGWRR